MVRFSGKLFRLGEKIRLAATSTVRVVTSTDRASRTLAKRKPRTSGMYGV